MYSNISTKPNNKLHNGKPVSDENRAALSKNCKIVVGDKPNLKAEKKNVPLATKGQRAPLGTIHSNVNGQQKRIGHQVLTRQSVNRLTSSNIPDKIVGAAVKQRFAVHEDEENETRVGDTCKTTTQTAVSTSVFTDENEDKNSNVEESKCEPTASVRQPLSTLSLNQDNHKVSPMVQDSSVVSQPSSILCDEKLAYSSACYIREDLLVPHYAEDVYKYLREFEARCKPKPNYMKKQPDITNGMRSILVDWLVEVAEEYKLQPETLYLAVGYIDRFLSCMSVLRGKLQLVGTASMFISSKYEEIYPPDVEEFVFITDNTYTKKQVLRMEQIILKVLAFDLSAPTVYQFLQHYFHLGNLNEKTRNLALYLGELTLLEADPYLQFLPSVIAGAIVCLACHTVGQDCWPERLEAFTGYSIEDFKICLQYLFKSYVNAPNYQQQSVREKYRSSKYLEVANILPPITQPI